MRSRARADPGADAAAVAGVVQRLAVLLDAGLTPLTAWRAVAADPAAPAFVASVPPPRSAHELPERIRLAIDGTPVRDRGAWLALAAALEVAGAAGAPLAPALSRLAGVLRGQAQTARQVATALAGPVATARIVVLLPLVGLLFSAVIGVDALGTLFTTPPGWVCLAIGAALLGGAAAGSARMVRTARRADPDAGLELEMLAIALSGGLGIDAARTLVDAALEGGAGVGTGARAGGGSGGSSGAAGDDRDDRAGAVLRFSREAGVPAGALLRAEAEEARRETAAEAERRAAVLGVRLMLPLGLGVLPAFIVLGVVPMLLSLASSTLGSL